MPVIQPNQAKGCTCERLPIDQCSRCGNCFDCCQCPKPPLARLVEDQPDTSVFYDSLSDVELLLSGDTQYVVIRVGNDRLALSPREWRGLCSGVLNLAPRQSWR
jgi:hypothetical protein